MTILYAILLLGVLIFVHELGHLLFAKVLGVKVLRFSIGLGPSIVAFKPGDTEYVIAPIPFGGYIKMLGESTSMEDIGQDEEEPLTEEDLARAFNRQPIWKRALITVAGASFNIVFAFLIYLFVFGAFGEPRYLPVAGEIMAESPAERAGLMEGDRIVSVDGEETKYWYDMTALIQESGGRELHFAIDRDGVIIDKYISPEMKKGKTLLGEDYESLMIGIKNPERVIMIDIGAGKALENAVRMTYRVGMLIFEVLIKLIERAIPSDTVGGPVMIVQMAGKQAQKGFADFLFLMAAISVNLGVLNLLPIPVLDGGSLVFMAIEALRRKPLSEKSIMTAQKVGLALLLTLMVFVTYNDLVRVFTGKGLP
jgi:regulator of sigma E protease